ncbi:putative aconitase subunit 1 [Archaeoglobus sulfaticallidus PM70-1]|uniref:Phosphomevalonate dehydratase large subunit n=1 Tax=Archaeoglobus sulfaticallidus PM70-1 TaxID=387631 RepID=N0BDD3_9EURY|nr:aconitase X catalytic domain-containing protein [Archaeoglobus sulfaticallidus]AGK60998.1 putative aconitase subunit 1 [Archaeoglobus sulfaticallidus PM70-1]
MYLSKEEEKLLESDNETIRKAMEILVAIGKIFDADRLIPVKSVQISGISYKNIGDAGLEWFESLNAKFVIKAMINPAGMDVIRWKEMGIDEGFYRKQMRIINALIRLGADKTLTCTPYYFDSLKKGDHVAWAESNAIVYANSILGVRTNRESGISALASGIIGKTPNYGLHVKKNRSPTVIVDVKAEINSSADLAMLGYSVGEKLSNSIPYFIFRNSIEREWLKDLGAVLAAKGNTALFHAEGLTPEYGDFEIDSLEREVIDELEEIEFDCEPDLIAIGCPHLSSSELRQIADLLFRNDKKVRKDVWLFTSRRVLEENEDVARKIESYGVKVFADTCMVVSPATENYECVMVNSGKALTYLPKHAGVMVKFGDIKECIKEAYR